MAMGLGFQGDIWFWEEANYGEGERSGGTMVISDKVLDVRIDTGDIYKPIRGISEPSICAFISQPSDPVVHIEWVLQPKTPTATIGSLATYCADRTSTGTLKSVAFIIGANTFGATKSYWLVDGCIAKNITYSSSRGNEITCAADFSAQSVATYATLTAALGAGFEVPSTALPTALGTKYAVFNVAGGIAWTGRSAGAFITDSCEITIENNLMDLWDSDSAAKVGAVPGPIDITGSCDISLDDGGAVHWGDVYGSTAKVKIITVTTGCTGIDDTWTLTGVQFNNTSIDINTSDAGMMASQPFIAKKLAIS